VNEAAAAYKDIEEEDHTAELENARFHVQNTEEEHFYKALAQQFEAVVLHAGDIR
jgi:hypothetical protein